MGLTAEDRRTISGAMRDAEALTSGEIVCVLAETSTPVQPFAVIFATLAALALPWALTAFTTWPVYRLLAAQVAAFVLLLALLTILPFHVPLLPRRLQRAHGYRAAMEQFVQRGLAHTNDRGCVLIFVSRRERYARIIANNGLAAKVPQAAWQATLDRLLAHMSAGNAGAGFVGAIGDCAAIMSPHSPPQTGAGHLPDRIYEI